MAGIPHAHMMRTQSTCLQHDSLCLATARSVSPPAGARTSLHPPVHFQLGLSGPQMVPLTCSLADGVEVASTGCDLVTPFCLQQPQVGGRPASTWSPVFCWPKLSPFVRAISLSSLERAHSCKIHLQRRELMAARATCGMQSLCASPLGAWGWPQ